MKLRSLTLVNVRKFAGQSATISGIGDGVTVVSEANEFGKSTFFDALHALFFLKYGAATREVKSLQPHSGGAVKVRAQIELPAGLFTLEKSFLAQKRAVVKDAGGSVIALDDEAEHWIAQLMGTGIEGPAGLLWVRQGTTALEPAGSSGAEKSEKERLLGARRDLLSSVAGEIDMVTGGRRMDRVIEAAMQALGRLATASGQPKTNGPWKDALLETQALTLRYDELEKVCHELSDALAQRREVAARLATLEAPCAQQMLDAALETAQAAYHVAQDHAEKLSQAQGQMALKQLELEGAQAKLDKLLAAAADVEQTRGQLGHAKTAFEHATQEARAADAATEVAQKALTDASAALAHAQAAKEALQHETLHRNAVEKHDQLHARLVQVMQKRDALEQARAALAAMPVTAQVLETVENAQAAVLRAQAEAAAGGVQMYLEYDAARKVSRNGAALEAGAHRVAQRAVFDLPGIGRMTLDPGDAAADMAAVATADAVLMGALDAAGVADVDAARRSAVARRDTAAQIALLESLQDALAPDGIEHLQAAVAQARAAQEASRPAHVASPADPVQIQRDFQAAQDAEQSARATYELSRDTRDGARTALARAQALRDGARTAFDLAHATYGDPHVFDTRKQEAARTCALAEVAVADATAAWDALHKAAPDLATAQADLARATSAAQNARDERQRLITRNAALGATIRARAEDGVEESRDEVAGLLQAATERAARFGHEAQALMLLVDALRKKRGAAQDAYFGPVQRELAPLLALLHADAALSFDPASLLPQGLARGGTPEPVDMLSSGTQEQIAILTRLAFARLFARQGKPMPIILDDALVYSDDTRIVAMFTALHRVSADQQVIVFSCRQMAFAGLGGTRPLVEIVQDG